MKQHFKIQGMCLHSLMYMKKKSIEYAYLPTERCLDVPNME